MEKTLDRLETRNGWGRSPSLPSLSGDASSPIRYANVPRCRPVADLASGRRCSGGDQERLNKNGHVTIIIQS